MKTLVCAFVVSVSAACTVGAPPGFSSGDRWIFPLVGPLEDGLLVTPVSIDGHGPYLFAIDPDATISAVDRSIVDQAKLRTGAGPHWIDETNKGRPRFYAELRDLKVGGLTIDRRDAMVIPDGLYDSEGRRISGILGRDVIADSLVFGFDRAQGIAMLTTVKAFKAPPDAVAVRYEVVSTAATSGVLPDVPQIYEGGPSTGTRAKPRITEPGGGRRQPDILPVPRRLAKAQVGDGSFLMHLDLGSAVSQLRQAKWDKAKLSPLELKLSLVDEAASTREVTAGGWADASLAGARAPGVTFVPYIEKRFDTAGADGALGLDFFRPYAVYANWDKRTYYLSPRADAASTVTARIGRWGAALPVCPHVGCVTAEVVASGNGVGLRVVRDAEAAGRPLEVLLGVTPAPGQAAAPLVVELTAGANQLDAPLANDYAGAKLAVLDASPFPRSCPGADACVFPVGARVQASPDRAAQAKLVPLDQLHRRGGEPAIPPSGDAVKAAAGKPLAVAIVRLCLSASGAVESTKLVKSSGVAAYDEELQRTIQATWAFDPFAQGDGPAPVCTQATFQPQ